jgi:hypothetical protein
MKKCSADAMLSQQEGCPFPLHDNNHTEVENEIHRTLGRQDRISHRPSPLEIVTSLFYKKVPTVL